MILIEACVESVAAALAAESHGAGRVELAADPAGGGVTPSVEAMGLTGARLSIPMHVLIRPRGGDFVVSSEEREVMSRDIAVARAAGAAGVVLGALTPEGSVDRDTSARLIARARPMSVTFHRAFDATADPLRALDILLELGVDRLLTSGQAPTALAGADLIGRLVAVAGDRLAIMAGGGIRAHNVVEVVRRSGVREVHSRDISGIPQALMRSGSAPGTA